MVSGRGAIPAMVAACRWVGGVADCEPSGVISFSGFAPSLPLPSFELCCLSVFQLFLSLLMEVPRSSCQEKEKEQETKKEEERELSSGITACRSQKERKQEMKTKQERERKRDCEKKRKRKRENDRKRTQMERDR